MRWRVALLPILLVVAVCGVGAPGPAPAAPGSPGSVLATRPLPDAAALPAAAAGHRVTYVTTDRGGRPRTSTGAVYVPASAPPPGGWPVVSYAHGTIGLADGCEPSSVGNSAQEAAYLDEWLRRGYAVVATDYAGLGTPGDLAYLDGVAAGHDVVDMVRAARTVEPALSRTWVAAGLSQGGHAALHTARLATAYAPDLDYRGAVALGAPTNLDLVFPLGRPGVPDVGVAGLTKFTLFAMVGMRSARPDLDIDSYLSPRGRDLADLATRVCTADVGRAIGSTPVGDLFSRPLDDLRPAITDYISVPAGGYDRPVFLGQGAADLVVPLPLTLLFAEQVAAAGSPVTMRVYPSADHMGTPAASFDDSVAFVDALVR